MRVLRPDACLSAAADPLPTFGAIQPSFASKEFPTCACRQLSKNCGIDSWTFDHKKAFKDRLFKVNPGLDHLPGAYRHLTILAQGKISTKTGTFLAKRCARTAGTRHNLHRPAPQRLASETHLEMIAETFAAALYCWRNRPEHFSSVPAPRSSCAQQRASPLPIGRL